MLDLADNSDGSHQFNAKYEILQKISSVLDYQISDLFHDRCDNDVGRIADLLRLWGETFDGPGRHRILAVARQEATRSRTSIAAE